jgi:hypothetical protein
MKTPKQSIKTAALALVLGASMSLAAPAAMAVAAGGPGYGNPGPLVPPGGSCIQVSSYTQGSQLDGTFCVSNTYLCSSPKTAYYHLDYARSLTLRRILRGQACQRDSAQSSLISC